MLTTHSEYRWYRDSIYIARSLIIANLIFLLFSPPLTAAELLEHTGAKPPASTTKSHSLLNDED